VPIEFSGGTEREESPELAIGVHEHLRTTDVLRLDYLSCVLTILSTVLIGRRLWQGWVIAGVNSVIICVIGVRTAQLGFVPANAFCIALYAYNLVSWRRN